MDADVLLLAAGYGKRLRELTRETPKPLIRVSGRPLIDWNLDLLAQAGVRRVLINVHYRGELIREHVGDGGAWGLEVVFVEEPILLETGGAMKNVEPLLQHETLLTLNSDNLLDRTFSLQWLLDEHRNDPRSPLATLVVVPSAREKADAELDQSGRICALRGQTYAPGGIKPGVTYIGVQAVKRRLLSFLPERGSVFSITRDAYPKLLAAGELFKGLPFNGFWAEVGTPEMLLEAEARFSIHLLHRTT